MEQKVLISELRNEFNLACQKNAAGHEDEAQVHLVKMLELLTDVPELEAGGDQVIEDALNPPQD